MEQLPALIEQLTGHYGRLNQFMHTHSATQTASNLPLDMFNQYLSFKVLNPLGLRSSLIMTWFDLQLLLTSLQQSAPAFITTFTELPVKFVQVTGGCK